MTTIHFRCVRCQHPVEAPAENSGQSLYCPVCYLALRVPTESRVNAAEPAPLYTVDAAPADVRDMQSRKSLVSLPCPICHTNIAVSREQIGTEISCPECDTKVFVPQDIVKKINRAVKDIGGQVLPILDADTTETYGVRDVLAPASSDDLAGPDYIRVRCKLCGTIMYATEESIGQELTCPDCETKTLVTPRPKAIPKPPPLPAHFEGATTFGVVDKNSVSKNAALVPVVCKLCGTRMYAQESEIGGLKTCPDCGVQTEIKAVPPQQRAVFDPPDGEYDVRMDQMPPPRPRIRTLVDYRAVEGALDREHYQNSSQHPADEGDEEELQRRALRMAGFSGDDFDAVPFERTPLPAYPFVTRIFRSFRDPFLITRTLLALFLFYAGYGIGMLLPGLWGVISGAFGTYCILMGLGVMANTCHNLFHWTASGNDVPYKDEWIEYQFVDSNVFAVWLFLVAILAATPGYFVTEALTDLRPAAENNMADMLRDFFILLASFWLFFPILFLSSMESGSYFMLLAPGTLRSIPYRTGVWIRFYLLTGLMAVLLVTLGHVSAFYVTSALMFFLLPLPLFTLFTLLYFRLMGRLAWTLEELNRQDIDDERDHNAI